MTSKVFYLQQRCGSSVFDSMPPLPLLSSIFARMSAAHRIEMRTGSLRCAGPLRNKQRVQDKKILRRELESFRREQVALRQEWEAAAGTLSLLALLVQTYVLALRMGSCRSRTPQSGIR